MWFVYWIQDSSITEMKQDIDLSHFRPGVEMCLTSGEIISGSEHKNIYIQEYQYVFL